MVTAEVSHVFYKQLVVNPSNHFVDFFILFLFAFLFLLPYKVNQEKDQ